MRDSASLHPIAGAVVTLLDSAGTAVGRNLSDERGAYRVGYTHAAQRLRVVRIGFLPLELSLTDSLSHGESVEVRMVPFSARLGAVQITDKSNCPRRQDRAVAFALWEQARAGLLNTVVARESHPMSVQRLGFERTFDGNSEKVTRFLVWEDSARSSETSFNAVHNARDFVSSGFSTVSNDTTLMFGPDADVLLDDAFASGYCFRVVAPARSRPSQIGLGFGPPDQRPGRVDIEGTLWLDTAARSLRDIEFQYLGLPAGTDAFHPGGSISFRSMTDGVSFIDRWKLRRVDALQDTIPDAVGANLKVRNFLYATENGGEVAHARWSDGRSWNATLGTLRVRATRSSGRPAIGATVVLPNTPYRASSDSAGDLVIPDLLPGPYSAVIDDPRVAVLGFMLPTKLSFLAARDSTHEVTLVVPTAEEYVAGLCQQQRQWEANDSTFILGRIVGAGGKPVDDVRVKFGYWSDALRTWFFQKWIYTTGTNGVFQVCSQLFAPGTKAIIRISRHGHREEDIVRDVTSRLTVVLIRVPDSP